MAGSKLLSVCVALLVVALSGCDSKSPGSEIPDSAPAKNSGRGGGVDGAVRPRFPSGSSHQPGRRPPGNASGLAPVPKTTCGDENGWQYCVHRYSGNNPEVLYYVHSFTDSHFGWTKGFESDQSSQLTRLQALLGENSPTVVVISYVHRVQDSWLLALSDRKTRPPEISTVKHFTTEAMPLIEQRFDLHGPRTVYGFSMGGFNATQLCLNAPHLWEKCIIQNAVLVTCDPFSQPEWTQFFCLPGYLIRKQFTPEEWRQNDPLHRLDRVNASTLPSILVTNSKADQFNLFENGRVFAEELRAKGARVQWHPIDGEHSDFDADAIYQFLAE